MTLLVALDGLTLAREVVYFARDPFTVATEGDFSSKVEEVILPIDEGKFLLELVYMQSSITLGQGLGTKGPAKFRSEVNVHQFPNAEKVGIFVLSMLLSLLPD